MFDRNAVGRFYVWNNKSINIFNYGKNIQKNKTE